MFSFKVHKAILMIFLMTILIVFCAPSNSDAKRVIFYSKPSVFRGQLFATSAKLEPCPKCQMRDHRGRCRRILSSKTDRKC